MSWILLIVFFQASLAIWVVLGPGCSCFSRFWDGVEPRGPGVVGFFLKGLYGSGPAVLYGSGASGLMKMEERQHKNEGSPGIAGCSGHLVLAPEGSHE